MLESGHEPIGLFSALLSLQNFPLPANNPKLSRNHFSYKVIHLSIHPSIHFNIDRGLVSGILILDLKKAFGTVDHQLLLTKLE